MKKKYSLVLIVVFLSVAVFAFGVVTLTNRNLRKMYEASYDNTFYLISAVVDDYFRHEKEIQETETDAFRSRSVEVAESPGELDRSLLTDGLEGIWILNGVSSRGISNYENLEMEVIRLYEQTLKAKNAHTLVSIEETPFILSNTVSDSIDVLILSETKAGSALEISRLLDSLIVSSDLRYFSILDETQTPVIFGSLYENFLPMKGEGSHTVQTPGGNIYQIEARMDGRTVVAGFAMSSLEKMQSANRFFVTVLVLAFVALEGVFLFNFFRFDRFKMRKEREVHLFREIGALSTGFAHEFRNSLHTLSLLARDLHGEARDVLVREIDRMKKVMDSLRLIGSGRIDKQEIDISELIDGSISLLRGKMADGNVAVEKVVAGGTTLHGNRSLLLTAFSNILRNGIEAGAKNLTIRAFKKGNTLHVDFADNGEGIASELINRIFDPFFSKKEQSGLGLYLAKRIVEAHGGQIGVRSAENTVIEIAMRVK
jgi:nitrogen-specific signal transduction histidine kinase